METGYRKLPRHLRIDCVRRNRQRDLLVYLYMVSNPHNLSAIIRTCEAVGVGKIYFTMKEGAIFEINKEITMGAHKWMDIEEVEDPKSFIESMKDQGFKTVATALTDEAKDYRTYDYTQPTLIIMGNESTGIDEDVLNIVDVIVRIPQYGMVQSLNVSVATAIILYEALTQRERKGMYKPCVES